jgi:hypothetical protein
MSQAIFFPWFEAELEALNQYMAHSCLTQRGIFPATVSQAPAVAMLYIVLVQDCALLHA